MYLETAMGSLGVDYLAVKLEGACQGHRVGYFRFAMICKKLLPEIEAKWEGSKAAFFGKTYIIP